MNSTAIIIDTAHEELKLNSRDLKKQLIDLQTEIDDLENDQSWQLNKSKLAVNNLLRHARSLVRESESLRLCLKAKANYNPVTYAETYANHFNIMKTIINDVRLVINDVKTSAQLSDEQAKEKITQSTTQLANTLALAKEKMTASNSQVFFGIVATFIGAVLFVVGVALQSAMIAAIGALSFYGGLKFSRPSFSERKTSEALHTTERFVGYANLLFKPAEKASLTTPKQDDPLRHELPTRRQLH